MLYVWNREAQDEGIVHVFSKAELAQAFCDESDAKQQTQPSSHEDRISPQALEADGFVTLWEHADFDGDDWVFHESWGNIPDFRRVYPTLWWFTNINDRVSSIENGARSRYLALWEHINFQGDGLFVTFGFLPDLSLLGWNDRASSMSYEMQFPS